MKNNFKTIARVLLSVALLGALLWFLRAELRDVREVFSGAQRVLIYIALGLAVVNILLLSGRFKLIFSGERLNIGFYKAVQLTMVGYFFNNFMPTSIGGDVMKAHYISKMNQKRVKSYTSVMMDRLIGLYTYLAIGLAALLIDMGRYDYLHIKVLILVLVLFGSFLVVAITNRTIAVFLMRLLARIKLFSIGEKLNRVYEIVHDYRNRGGIVAGAFAVSVIAQCFYFSVAYLLFRAIGVDVGLGNLFLIMPVVTFISMLPSVGGLGFREGAMVAFFAPIAGRGNALAASLLFLVCYHVFVSVLGGVVYLCWNLRTVTQGSFAGNVSKTNAKKGDGNG